MRAALEELQSTVDADQGSVTGADGRTYSRRGSKTKRRVCDEIVATGCPIVLHRYSSGQFEWLDQEDAASAWAEIRSHVVATEPTTKQLTKHAMWTAGIWESDDGSRLLFLSGHC